MNQQYQDISIASSENMSLYTSGKYWVIKPREWGKTTTEKNKFNEELNYVITDRSIGICFNIRSPLTENSTDEEIRQSSIYFNQDDHKPSVRMISDFLSKIDIGDKVIIGKGATESLFVCTIDSTPYFTDREATRLRRRIKDIERVPENFQRKYFRYTLQVYN